MSVTSPLSIHPYISNPDITHSQPDKLLLQPFTGPNLRLTNKTIAAVKVEAGTSLDLPPNAGIHSAPGTASWGWPLLKHEYGPQPGLSSALQAETTKAAAECGSGRRRKTLESLVNQKKKHKRLVQLIQLSHGKYMRELQQECVAVQKHFMWDRVIFPRQQVFHLGLHTSWGSDWKHHGYLKATLQAYLDHNAGP